MAKIIAAVLIILCLLTGSVAAAGSVRLVLMDGINLEHLQDERYGNFHFIINNGALGLANASTAGSHSRENAVLTLACGSRALGPKAGSIYSGNEELETGMASEVHARCTGVRPPTSALVLPAMALITAANADLLHTVRPGYLGDTLTAADKTIAVLVNGSKDGDFREGAAVAISSEGIIPRGRLETSLADNPNGPFGSQSELKGFLEAVEEQGDCDLLIIDLGDTSRSHDYLPLITAERQGDFRHQALIQLDTFLGELLKIHQQDDLLLVVSLQADRTLAKEQSKMLVPVLAYGRELQGLLTSPTTRRSGVVANIDVTATILSFHGLYRKGDIYGQPLTSRPHPDPFGYLLLREREMAFTYRLRSPLIKGFIALILFLLTAALAAFIFKWHGCRALQLLLIMVVATPLALLVLAPLTGSLWLVPAWVAFTLAVALALKEMTPETAMVLLGAATALMIVVDALLGAPLQQRSILGYDAIAGARYYGIGNEYMGALLGSTLLGLGGALSKNRKLAGLVMAAIALILMLPGVGANFGGALAALVGFSISLAGIDLIRNKKSRIMAALGFVIAILILVVVNSRGNQSHVGRFISGVQADPGEFWRVVSRKLDMSWRLIRWSLWTKVFAALLATALWIIITLRHRLIRRLGRFWPQARGGFAAALAALAFNDSGIVAAATTLLYITLPLLYYWFSSSSLARDSHSP